MSPSIRDVAQLAGVGKGTVSRVLNERPGVSPKTAARVRQAISELSYRPHIQARRLARNVSDLICFVLSNRDILHEFHSMVLKGVQNYCASANRDVVFALWRYPLDGTMGAVTPPRIVADRGSVDGVVLAGANHVECVKAITQQGTPCVAFGNNLVGCNSLSEVDAVWYDEAVGTREAVKYLADLGHRHIRFAADLSVPWFARNFRAFSDAMIRLGLAPMSIPVGPATEYAEIAERTAEFVVNGNEPTTAVFAGNDAIGVAVIRALARRSVRVPDDVSVMGFDDVPRCLDVDPYLTSVHVPTEELGCELARFLFEKIEGPAGIAGARVVPTHLVIRNSCAAPCSAACG